MRGEERERGSEGRGREGKEREGGGEERKEDLFPVASIASIVSCCLSSDRPGPATRVGQ